MTEESLTDVLLSQGLLSSSALVQALEYQKKYGGNLGHILDRLGYVSSVQSNTAEHAGIHPPRLGEMLLEKGSLSPENLQKALEYQKVSGGQIGEILISLNLIRPVLIYDALAEQCGGERWRNRLDIHVAHRLPESLSRKYRAIPVWESPRGLDVVSDHMLLNEEIAVLSAHLGASIQPVLATPFEMERLWRSVYGTEMLAASIEELAISQPKNSAKRVLTPPQWGCGLLLLLLVAVGLALAPLRTMLILNGMVQGIYIIFTVFKAQILGKGLLHSRRRNAKSLASWDLSSADLAAPDLPTADLPVYTILVPVYREAHMLETLVKHIEALDYPKQKLDVRILMEEEDIKTQHLAKSLKLPYYYTFVMVPESQPKTKPKACNYGLIHARGQYVVIYDAEDWPEADQLKKVLHKFRSLPENYACIQARLNYYNSEQNLLTRWFTQEYSNWFGILLPGVIALDIPIPLGGTSNHFKTDILKQVNAWDPYNVTEDADLGIRLYKLGFKTAVVDSTTWEEANSQFVNWMRQRTRWIKGYVQTWLVHMRNPVQLYRELGSRGFWGFQAMILGTPLLPLLNPFFWALMVVWYATHVGWIPTLFPGALYYLASILLIVGNFFFVYSNVVGMYEEAERSRENSSQVLPYGLVLSALATPVYWAMMSFAAYRALWQLMRQPSYWEKTHHGLTNGGGTGDVRAVKPPAHHAGSGTSIHLGG